MQNGFKEYNLLLDEHLRMFLRNNDALDLILFVFYLTLLKFIYYSTWGGD